MQSPEQEPNQPTKKEIKKAEEMANDARSELEISFEENDLFAVIKENFATLQTFSDERETGNSLIEEGIEKMEKYGYELSGPLSITYVPDEYLSENRKTGRGAMIQKATFKRIRSEK